ncbi:MAG: hypothetical protein RRC07_03915 [Anaerolineae bacterium]|nr:hypothetical protein [Anaerolineae bacterium]
MNIFILAGIVGIVVILLGVLLAGLFTWLSRAVKENAAAPPPRSRVEQLNPAETFGFLIPVAADVPEQLSRARKLAAAKAAAQPRGANMRIAPGEETPLQTASDELELDPLTAVRIAAFHTWQGAKLGPPAGGVPQQPTSAPAAAPAPTKSPEDLVPGVDYPFTEITDDMSPDEVRKARIANAKARSQAVKALKQRGEQATAVPTAGAPGEPVVAEQEKVSPAAAGIPEPEYIEISDDMSPDEVRKARIANARARSAYNKALKEAGVDPSQVTTVSEQPAAAPAATEESAQAARPAEPTPAAEREAVAVPTPDIPEPDYIEITDDMDADEVRKARVQNAKMRSQFFKELKERGIDPKEWEAQQAAVADAAADAGEQVREAAAPAAEPPAGQGGDGVELPANIAPPNYIRVTDDMQADEVRQARVANARERSRFFKALKEAGIDPKELPAELTQP